MFKDEIYEKCGLHPPKDTEIIDTPVAIVWMDNDGILYSIAKNIPRTIGNLKETFKILKTKIGDKKVCLITDTTQTPPYTIEAREFLERQMYDLYKAVASLSCSPKAEMMSSILFMGKKPYPAKTFNNANLAKEWIMKYNKDQ